MIKTFIPVIICFCMAILFSIQSLGTSQSMYVNMYPNLPAPIADEKLLITSAGQAAESSVLLSIAENLNLEADYRPRALSTDLYDYNSVVIMLGFSINGLSQTERSYREELSRITALVAEARATELPIILVNISGKYRNNTQTWKLFEQIAPSADYFIGLKNMKKEAAYVNLIRKHSIPVTLVNKLEDLQTPFNSVFR
ncbi:hypothetical protein GCM10007063_24620 [Lentibacillus kapialis]|uniref:DUF6305 domain-containing protein n=1 Tax=Lentibacillus kapialis TaxID=340214 RepID=A0A917UZN5_9BACI|nr:DUF6305 family protein [Lentibacillus kapialis]GGK01412.1 hypothetical protein GCM10007063_24620 [Lentibacillus kapialis]